jgi:hypothetical protein
MKGMPEAALAFFFAYLGLAFGLRSLLQLRRRGETGFKGIGGRPAPARLSGSRGWDSRSHWHWDSQRRS